MIDVNAPGYFGEMSLAQYYRMNRTRLLSETDWMELPSAASRIAPEILQEWMDYRQALRDMQFETFPIQFPPRPQSSI